MNRIQKLFESGRNNILNIYFTAGHPTVEDIIPILTSLQSTSVDIVEIGMPYSDPLADGLTIQQSSKKALENGMQLNILFDILIQSKHEIHIPIILMGYFNQIYQFGVEGFLRKCEESCVDGLIIPDLPSSVFEREYKDMFAKYNISTSFLVTPETSDQRVLEIGEVSNAFVYVVSQSRLTGGTVHIEERHEAYLERLHSLLPNIPKLIGFGISDKESFDAACRYADGAIIGSAFIKFLDENGVGAISEFVKRIKGY